MLYDPKWEQQTKTDPFTLESLIAWLEKRPADNEYCYTETGECLLAQYFSASGYGPVLMGANEFGRKGIAESIPLPVGFNKIALGYPRTFGAALERARSPLTSA